MTPAQHAEKARRILAGLRKLDAAADRYAFIDGTMVVGYHLGNAALHRHGLSDESVHFNTPSKLDRPLGSLPAAVRPAYEAFAALEDLRSAYVRNPLAPDESVAREALRLMATMSECCGVIAD